MSVFCFHDPPIRLPHSNQRVSLPPDDLLKVREAIGQCGGPGLQNQGRLDFVEMVMLHRRNAVEASPRHDPLWSKFLSTPRANDQIGFPRDYLISCHNAVLDCTLVSTIGEDIDAAGDLDELRNHPIPEISGSSHSSKNTLGRFCKLSARSRASARPVSSVLFGPPAHIHHRAEHPDHSEDPRDGPLIERVGVDPAADQTATMTA
jgi:hypothetical protein